MNDKDNTYTYGTQQVPSSKFGTFESKVSETYISTRGTQQPACLDIDENISKLINELYEVIDPNKVHVIEELNVKINKLVHDSIEIVEKYN